MQGIALSRQFYLDIVRPFLQREVPGLRHAAALVDSGSEVLGFDDLVSRDHNWGPRVQIIVDGDDLQHAAHLVAVFRQAAPSEFMGEPLGWRSRVTPPPSAPEVASSSEHGVEFHTMRALLERHFAVRSVADLRPVQWLGFAEQRLLAFTAGPVFYDDDGGLTEARRILAYYPRDVWFYRIACQWRRIAEEQAFVGRTGQVGDDIGSRVIAARLIRDIMRLAFLLERRYAPYAKWIGRAFADLPISSGIMPHIQRALRAEDWTSRGEALAQAFKVLAERQNELDISTFECRIGPYHTRPFATINADDAVAAVHAGIVDPAIKDLPVIGALDQVTDLTPVLEHPALAQRMMRQIEDLV